MHFASSHPACVAQIPIKGDEKAQSAVRASASIFARLRTVANIAIPHLPHQVLEKVRRDKLREVTAGCDGTWVAHPGLTSLDRNDPLRPPPNTKRAWVNVEYLAVGLCVCVFFFLQRIDRWTDREIIFHHVCPPRPHWRR
jgi:hypothetical protein